MWQANGCGAAGRCKMSSRKGQCLCASSARGRGGVRARSVVGREQCGHVVNVRSNRSVVHAACRAREVCSGRMAWFRRLRACAGTLFIQAVNGSVRNTHAHEETNRQPYDNSVRLYERKENSTA